MKETVRKVVVFGFIGTNLDSGYSEKRFEKWRPTVSLFQHDDFIPHRLELLSASSNESRAVSQVMEDCKALRPQSTIANIKLDIKDPWDFQEVYGELHEFARNYQFEEDCDYFVHLTTGTHVMQICLFLLTKSRHIPAKIIESFTHHAAPLKAAAGRLEVIDLDLSTYDALAGRLRLEEEEAQSVLKGGIATKNVKFNKLIERLEKVALRSSAPLLLTGPTGAGKSELAARVYALRNARHQVRGALVAVNCATLSGDNAMSTLFGHKKGSFTGAVSDRAGLLRQADGGLLFLDEVGELGLDEQAMLLKALEEKTFYPLGSDKEVQSDFQLVAGTNQNLQQRVAEGKFRADLLARLNVWQFELPGLAERPEDIVPNIDYEVQKISQKLGRQITFTRDARAAYIRYALGAKWEGNFRDLSASLLRMATLADNGVIGDADAHDEIEHLEQFRLDASAPSANKRSLVQQVLPSEMLAGLDRLEIVQLEEILSTIARTTTMAEAARELFAVSRTEKGNPNDSDRMSKTLKRWGLNYKELVVGLQGRPGHV
ncbi:RNA repair transcriptional activator RtcR [Nostoc sp. CHAB 5834]|nr:RNA repair transcriptional activator RtcR [Nostoc sp. CHAB 5834]